MSNVLETDFPNRTANTLGNNGGHRAETGGQGAEFVSKLQQVETDQDNLDVAIGVVLEPDTVPPSRRRATHAEVLERGSNLAVPQLSGPATDGPDFTAIEAKAAQAETVKPDAVKLEQTAIREQTQIAAATDATGVLAARLKPAVEPGTATVQVLPAAATPSGLIQPGIAAQIRDPKAAALPLTPEGLSAVAPEPEGAGLPVPGLADAAITTSKGGGLLVPDAASVILQPTSAPLVNANVLASAAPGLNAAGQSVITAAPAEIVDIISQSLSSSQERKDRIIVQLDPPELGRVSIDFKFDAQGLQHVTITGETPEALRRLRMMHSDLIQTLEDNGLDGQSMTFRHEQQQAGTGAGTGFAQVENEFPDTATLAVEPAQPPPNRASSALLDGGLDIKL